MNLIEVKCKQCGGKMDPVAGEKRVGKCQYCGTVQTIPILPDEHRANLYNRAEELRKNNDYDKASAIYEKILEEEPTDPEAYWSLVLCRYGIEYVEDAPQKYLPTVCRAQYTSIFADQNYKSAIKYADETQRKIYEKEANAINEIQKGILEIAAKEEPFDIFICYKESDEKGKRTRDSVIAQEMYHELTRVGYKVFFARVTLDSKIGSAYEPYIFSALNSAKVMVVLGTRADYFNAVWVKNEWSRFLAQIKNGEQKMLIPAYRDMDPYNLPEEFSHLQALDMGKLGFMPDLILGIQKMISFYKEEPMAAHVEAAHLEPTRIPMPQKVQKHTQDKQPEKGHKHQFVEEVVKPTCTTVGYTMHTCSCGEQYKDNYTPTSDHDYGDWLETIKPTCTTDGERMRQCKHCGNTVVEMLPGFDGHALKEGAVISENNKERVIRCVCSRCGYQTTVTKPTRTAKSSQGMKSGANILFHIVFWPILAYTVFQLLLVSQNGFVGRFLLFLTPFARESADTSRFKFSLITFTVLTVLAYLIMLIAGMMVKRKGSILFSISTVLAFVMWYAGFGITHWLVEIETGYYIWALLIALVSGAIIGFSVIAVVYVLQEKIEAHYPLAEQDTFSKKMDGLQFRYIFSAIFAYIGFVCILKAVSDGAGFEELLAPALALVGGYAFLVINFLKKRAHIKAFEDQFGLITEIHAYAEEETRNLLFYPFGLIVFIGVSFIGVYMDIPFWCMCVPAFVNVVVMFIFALLAGRAAK